MKLPIIATTLVISFFSASSAFAAGAATSNDVSPSGTSTGHSVMHTHKGKARAHKSAAHKTMAPTHGPGTANDTAPSGSEGASGSPNR